MALIAAVLLLGSLACIVIACWNIWIAGRNLRVGHMNLDFAKRFRLARSREEFAQVDREWQAHKAKYPWMDDL